MGNMRDEGSTIDVVSDGVNEILKGELYRFSKWNGIALSHVLPNDPILGAELGLAIDVGIYIWYILVPAGLVAATGDVLWWSAGEGFKKGPTDLVVAGTAGAIGPAAKVAEAKDGNNIVGVRVLNIA